MVFGSEKNKRDACGLRQWRECRRLPSAFVSEQTQDRILRIMVRSTAVPFWIFAASASFSFLTSGWVLRTSKWRAQARWVRYLTRRRSGFKFEPQLPPQRWHHVGQFNFRERRKYFHPRKIIIKYLIFIFFKLAPFILGFFLIINKFSIKLYVYKLAFLSIFAFS